MTPTNLSKSSEVLTNTILNDPMIKINLADDEDFSERILETSLDEGVSDLDFVKEDSLDINAINILDSNNHFLKPMDQRKSKKSE